MGSYYDKAGQPITLNEWVVLREDGDYYRVAETTVADRWWVSTVWLGLDHAFSWPGHERTPIIFETMVFDRAAEGTDRYLDLEQERYSTEVDARLGHERMVQLVSTLEEVADGC
jgi:hypothetical protein